VWGGALHDGQAEFDNAGIVHIQADLLVVVGLDAEWMAEAVERKSMKSAS
jgi:hypothetical protein